MKTKKILALALSLTMVFSLFCIFPSVSAEEAPADAGPAFESFNTNIYTTAVDVYGLCNNSSLSGMKYFYYYVKTNGTDGPVIRVAETSAGGGGNYFPKTDPTLIHAVRLNGTPVSWTAGGGNQLKFDGNNRNFEGYVILNIDDNLYDGWGGKDTISGLDAGNIDFLAISALNNAEKVGDFGFAKSYSDAVNAVSGKLNRYYDSEKVAPLSSYEYSLTADNVDKTINFYQDDVHSYIDKKWAGFYLKSEGWAQFNLALAENSGAWWWLSGQDRSFYYLKADGTMTEITQAAGNAAHGINTYYANPGAFDGYVIFNTESSIVDTHPGYTGNSDTELSLDALVSAKLFSFSYGENIGESFTVGDFALGTSADALKDYFLAKESVYAQTLNPIANTVSSGGKINNTNTEPISGFSPNWLGFYLNAGEAKNIELLFREGIAAGNGGYWTTTGKTRFISKNGSEKLVTNSGNGWLNGIPESFEGYVLMNAEMFTSHPASSYKDTENNGFNISDIQYLEVINSKLSDSSTNTNIAIQYLSVAENGNDLLAHLKTKAEGSHFENTSVINKNTFTRVKEEPGKTEFYKIKAYDYFDNSNAEMGYLGFRIKTDGNNGELLLGSIEKNGAMYWIGKDNTYYLVKNDGTVSAATARNNGDFFSAAAFDGYVVIPLSSLVLHPAYKDDNEKFDSENISSVQVWNNFGCDKSIGEFTFGATMSGLVDCLANADIAENAVMRGDTNNDGEIDIIDLVRLKKHYAGISTVTAVNAKSLDVNSDGNEDVDDIVALRKMLLLG